MLKETLLELLESNNDIRKNGELKLDQIRSENVDLYAMGMLQTMADEEFAINGRSMSFVLFWWGISFNSKDDPKNVWVKITPETKEAVKNAVMQLLKQIRDPILSKQIADLASELSETLYYLDKQGIWNDVLNLAFEFVSSTDSQLIITGLNIYTFLFVHLASELS